MKKIEVDVFDNSINSVVIKVPERKFPGVLIQGDTLWSIYASIHELKGLCDEKIPEDGIDLINGLLDQLSARLKIYEAALKAHQIKIPYNRTSDWD